MIMCALNEFTEGGTDKGERIAKVIARSGLCSRRDAELLIGEKRVSVNGAVIESAALDISPSDKVLVDGKPLAPREAPRLWRYHKPKGRVTTHKDPEGRPTVFEALPEGLPRLISVGRLDFNTEGLLLLTNDGDLARHLELPSTGWTRRYRVRAYGQIEQSRLDELAAGLKTGGVSYGPIEASLEREQGDNVWITLSIREGKNREVRSIMEHLGLTVNRLIRVSFGPFILGDLEPGQVEEVKISVLKDQLGPRLTRQLGVKREPLREERRLSPGRGKPTYLRRKPEAVERPERRSEERPMRRRRILPAEGGEEVKIELVPDRKPRPARFGPSGEGGPEQRPLRSRREETPGRADRERSSSGDDRKRWRENPRPGGERAQRGGEDRRSETGGERPQWKSRPERSGEDRRGDQKGERPRWKTSAERGDEGTRPNFRRREEDQRPERSGHGGPGGVRPRWKTSAERGAEGTRPHFRRGEEDQRPDAARERSSEGGHSGEERASRPRRFNDSRSGGDRPKSFERRFQRRDDKQRADAPAGSGEGGHSDEKRAYRPRRPDENRKPGDRPKSPERRFQRRDDGQRPAASERSGDDAPRGEKRAYRPRRPDDNRGPGDKPKSFEGRFQRREDGHEEKKGPRGDRESAGREAKGVAGAGWRRPEGRPVKRPGRGVGASEGAKPKFLEKRGSAGSRRGAPGRGEGGKPLKRPAGSGKRPHAPGKPRPNKSEETP